MSENNVIPFVSKGKKPTTLLGKNVGDIIDHGKIGSLDYEIYNRGVIHIFTKNLRFKKNISAFEDALDEINLDKIPDGKNHIMKGSGDNDHLVFTKKDGDIEITLKRREFGTIEKLRNILSRGRTKNKAVSS